MHIGYGHVFIIDIADLTTCGFTIETIPAYTSSKQRNEIAQFGLKPNSHLYFPPGTFPMVVGVRTPSAIDDKEFIGFTVNYVLDQKCLHKTTAGVRAECAAFLNKSMSHGLEKFWATEGNITSVKRYIESWNAIEFKASDDDASGFNM